MATDQAVKDLHKHAAALTSAEEHVSGLIRQIRDMQDRENDDIRDAFENRRRFQEIAAKFDELGLYEYARVAREGAALEEQQIERNQKLHKAQSEAIGLLQAIGGVISSFRQFSHSVARAFSRLFQGH